MKNEKIINFIDNLVLNLRLKVSAEEKKNLPEKIKEHTKGQLFEAEYIQDRIKEIIYEI